MLINIIVRFGRYKAPGPSGISYTVLNTDPRMSASLYLLYIGNFEKMKKQMKDLFEVVNIHP